MRSPTALFVGAWRLVSWERTSASGEVSYLYGRAPEGQLIYTANGRMSAQLMNPEAPPPDVAGSSQGEATADVAGSSPNEATAEVAKKFFAYWGTYSVDESAARVTHHVLGGLARRWVGRDQVRRYEFLSDDRLRLTADLENDDVAERAGFAGAQALVWERIP